jgi:hypothetical protein
MYTCATKNNTHKMHTWGLGRCGGRRRKCDFTLALPISGITESNEAISNEREILELRSRLALKAGGAE